MWVGPIARTARAAAREKSGENVSVTGSAPNGQPAAGPEPRTPGRLARMPRVVTGLVGVIVLAQAATLFLSPEAHNALLGMYGVIPAQGLRIA